MEGSRRQMVNDEIFLCDGVCLCGNCFRLLFGYFLNLQVANQCIDCNDAMSSCKRVSVMMYELF